jgi:hypothetical protein
VKEIILKPHGLFTGQDYLRRYEITSLLTLRVCYGKLSVGITTILSSPDSAPQTSPGRPCI